MSANNQQISLPDDYRLTTDLENSYAACHAVLSDLYILGWQLQDVLSEAMDGNVQRVVLISLTTTEQPEVNAVAVGVVGFDNLIQIFVKEEHRRRGLGTLIAQRLKEEFPLLSACLGIDGSEIFYNKNNISI